MTQPGFESDPWELRAPNLCPVLLSAGISFPLGPGFGLDPCSPGEADQRGAVAKLGPVCGPHQVTLARRLPALSFTSSPWRWQSFCPGHCEGGTSQSFADHLPRHMHPLTPLCTHPHTCPLRYTHTLVYPCANPRKCKSTLPSPTLARIHTHTLAHCGHTASRTHSRSPCLTHPDRRAHARTYTHTHTRAAGGPVIAAAAPALSHLTTHGPRCLHGGQRLAFLSPRAHSVSLSHFSF